MKNSKFYILLFLILFLFIELLSFYIVKVKKDNLNKHLSNKIDHSPEIIKKYTEYIPYTRDKNSFNKLINKKSSKNSHIKLNENIYFYTVINDFDNKNNENILLHGDSWAEVFNKKEPYLKLKKYSKINNLGFINAGITSFSPSPMTSQLNILKKEFKIEPSIIIAIIDQTDIGDELFRYKNVNESYFSPSLSNLKKDFQINAINNFNKNNFSTFKLIRYFYNYYSLHKNSYNLNNLEIIITIFKNVKAKFFNIPKVLYPLQFGINSKERIIIKERLNKYINFAFNNNNLKKIYFVSHPHLKHLDKKGYILNISSIIDETINDSNFKNKIEHIDFKKINKFINENVFIKTDPFSHLTSDAYLNYYLPKILEKIDY